MAHIDFLHDVRWVAVCACNIEAVYRAGEFVARPVFAALFVVE